MINTIKQLTFIFIFSLLFTSINKVEAAVSFNEQISEKEKFLIIDRTEPLKFAKNKIVFGKGNKVKIKLKNAKRVHGEISEVRAESIVIKRKGKLTVVQMEELDFIKRYNSDDYLISIAIFLATFITVAFNLLLFAFILAVSTFFLILLIDRIARLYSWEFLILASVIPSIITMISLWDFFADTSKKYKIGKKWTAKIE